MLKFLLLLQCHFSSFNGDLNSASGFGILLPLLRGQHVLLQPVLFALRDSADVGIARPLWPVHVGAALCLWHSGSVTPARISRSKSLFFVQLFVATTSQSLGILPISLATYAPKRSSNGITAQLNSHSSKIINILLIYRIIFTRIKILFL